MLLQSPRKIICPRAWVWLWKEEGRVGSVILRRSCSLAGAAVMKRHREGGSNSRNVLFHCAEPVSLKSRCGQGWLLLRAMRERSVPGLSPGFVASSRFPLSFHVVFPPCMALSFHMSLFGKDTSHTDLALTFMTSFDLIIYKVNSLSRVRLFATPWTVAHQAPLSMGFSRQEYWSGLPFPSPGGLPDSGMEPRFDLPHCRQML